MLSHEKMLVEQHAGQSIQGDFRFEPPKYGVVESGREQTSGYVHTELFQFGFSIIHSAAANWQKNNKKKQNEALKQPPRRAHAHTHKQRDPQ